MKRTYRLKITLIAALLSVQTTLLLGQTPTKLQPTLPVIVLAQSPADTQTDLQILCLFRSTPENQLHGSLTEIDQRLHGLIVQIRTPALFGGELGETILLTPPSGSIAAKRLLIIGLGDRATFTPERMVLVGKIALREANRLGVAHPYFAPTVLDGGVSQFTTDAVAEQVVRGLRDALATEAALRTGSAAAPLAVVDVTYLAGAKHAADTRNGIDRAFGRPASPSN